MGRIISVWSFRSSRPSQVQNPSKATPCRNSTVAVSSRVTRGMQPDTLPGDAINGVMTTQSPTRETLWSLRSAEVRTIECPSCGPARRAPCRTLRDRPVKVLHRGHVTRYLNIRFALDLAGPYTRFPSRGRRLASTAPACEPPALLTRSRGDYPLHELTDLIERLPNEFRKHRTSETNHRKALQHPHFDREIFPSLEGRGGRQRAAARCHQGHRPQEGARARSRGLDSRRLHPGRIKLILGEDSIRGAIERGAAPLA